MDDRKVAALAGVTTLVTAGTRLVPEVVVARLVGDVSEFPAWLRVGSTVGESVVLLQYIARSVGPLVAWGLVLGLGYYLGRTVDVREDYRRLVRALAGGSVGVLAVAALGLAAVQLVGGSLDVGAVLMLLFGLLSATVQHAVPVVLGGVAVATVTGFERERRDERDPREHGAEAFGGETAGSDGTEPVRERAVEDAD